MTNQEIDNEIMVKYDDLLNLERSRKFRLYFYSLAMWLVYLAVIIGFPQIFNDSPILSVWILKNEVILGSEVQSLRVGEFQGFEFNLPGNDFNLIFYDVIFKIILFIGMWFFSNLIKYLIVFQKDLKLPLTLLLTTLLGWFFPAIVNLVTFYIGATTFFVTINALAINSTFSIINWFHFILLYEVIEEIFIGRKEEV